MNREIQVLYTIFELELAPPFKLVTDPRFEVRPDILNRHSEKIGWTDVEDGKIVIYKEKEAILLNKIKRTFNVQKLSNDDVYHIAKHLFFWLQGKLTNKISHISIWDHQDTRMVIRFPRKGLNDE